jgi:hypothetical protein
MVTSPTRFWGALEVLPGLAAVKSEWSALLGAELQLIERLLHPQAGLATSLPRVLGSPYRVVEHGPDDFVGVCEDDGDTVTLAKSDLVVYAIDLLKLARGVTGALGLDGVPGRPEQLLPRTYLVGIHRPYAGYSFPVLLTLPTSAHALLRTACDLVARDEKPFLLLAPTPRRLTPGCLKILGDHQSCCLALSESVVFGSAGEWAGTEAGFEAVTRLVRSNIPSTDTAGAAVFFPTPTDTRWCDVRIRFLDGHTASVWAGGVQRTFNYTQMGMADGRNGNPTKQWELLRSFARENGMLSWKGHGANRKAQKQKENLSRDLKAFFRVAGEPIELTTDRRGWRTVFALDPDS